MTVSLLISDVDGTLVTKDKVLTERARAAVRALKSAGIKFAITSGRPPAGMAMFIEPLAIETPIAGFNGGVYIEPVGKTVIAEHLLDPAIASRALEVVLGHGLDAWIFTASEWIIRDRGAPLVAREQRTLAMQPVVVSDLHAVLNKAAKIVGVGEDYDLVGRCEAEMQATFADAVTAIRSQPYYLDITHPRANKGAVVDFLSEHLRIPTAEIAAIGDMQNDVRMFSKSGLSIAMGNATEAVKTKANRVTDSCEEEGFAKAVERIILADGAKER
jgi:hypothetical protein